MATLPAGVQAEAPSAGHRTLDPRTSLDHVHLAVRDLDREIAFYTEILGLKVHRRADGAEGRFAALGAGRDDLLRLTERPDAVRAERAAGMYHLCFLVRERVELA